MLVCQCRCGFLFKVGFWETGTWVSDCFLAFEGRGFESTTWFIRDVGGVFKKFCLFWVVVI